MEILGINAEGDNVWENSVEHYGDLKQPKKYKDL